MSLAMSQFTALPIFYRLHLRLSCVKRETEWHPGTHAVKLALPAESVRFPSPGPVIAAEQNTPTARLLLADLRACTEIGQRARLGVTARAAAVELLQGMLDEHVIDAPHLFPTLVQEAHDYIETD